jgi:hypothetical protein
MKNRRKDTDSVVLLKKIDDKSHKYCIYLKFS